MIPVRAQKMVLEPDRKDTLLDTLMARRLCHKDGPNQTCRLAENSSS